MLSRLAAPEEAQPREPVAADELVAATAGRSGNEDEAADLGSGGGHTSMVARIARGPHGPMYGISGRRFDTR